MTQATIKYEDGQAYEKGMGVWSQLAGQDFLEWLAPVPGLRSTSPGNHHPGGNQADHALTFKLDHSMGADQPSPFSLRFSPTAKLARRSASSPI